MKVFTAMVTFKKDLVKSLFDRLAAFSGIVVLSPLLLAISVAIKLEDGGPVLFRQERMGRDGKVFVCLKFRTMLEDAEGQLMRWKASNHPNWVRYVESNFKLKDDPRITRTGHWLRKTSLDELAQLFNILVGHMSVVGPRPLLAREVTDYGLDRFKRYCAMTPGLTGLWQISGRSDTSFDERAELDMQYFSKRSALLDLKIIFKTFKVLFGREGAY